MILRSITKHVKDQNWFAVFLDFFIVVVGILIAFQITNWSEKREARERERQIIDRLYTDFDALSSDTQSRIDFLNSIKDQIDEFKQSIIDYPENADLQLMTDFFQASFSLPSYADQSDTYEQLVASGGMSLLSNDSLRVELAKHATLTADFEHQDLAVREWSRPYFTSLVRLRELIDVMSIDEAVSKAGSKADLIVAVGMYQGVFNGHLSGHKTHLESIINLRNMLQKEQGK